MNKKEKKFIIIVLIVAVLAVAGTVLYKKLTTSTEEHQMAQVIYGNNVVMKEFDINVDAVYKLRGDYGTFEVEVKDGKYRMTNVECPNHNCEGFGWQPDDELYLPIICIPNNVAVVLVDEEE